MKKKSEKACSNGSREIGELTVNGSEIITLLNLNQCCFTAALICTNASRFVSGSSLSVLPD